CALTKPAVINPNARIVFVIDFIILNFNFTWILLVKIMPKQLYRWFQARISSGNVMKTNSLKHIKN
ncbi:MAG: hypothetical protein ACXWB6_00765, partial [Kaistella sp.]